MSQRSSMGVHYCAKQSRAAPSVTVTLPFLYQHNCKHLADQSGKTLVVVVMTAALNQYAYMFMRGTEQNTHFPTKVIARCLF